MSDFDDGEYDSDEGSTFDEYRMRDALYNHISGICSMGSFATFGIIQSFVIPGVTIDPFGIARLPLSAEDARGLIQTSRKAPFGKGTETIIDESVRKTWEIDATKVHFHNKRWQGCLDKIVERVASELGIAGDATNVRAELHKMLLYEKGAMFKAHRELVTPIVKAHSLIFESTEKVHGMLGTLVICLPSPHTGGAVCLQHGSKKARFDTSESSAFDASYIAWLVFTDLILWSLYSKNLGMQTSPTREVFSQV